MADSANTTDLAPEIPDHLGPDDIERAMEAGCEFRVGDTWSVRHDRVELVAGAMSLKVAARLAIETAREGAQRQS
jgi:hypothetical protein